MPTYQYSCTECAHFFETVQSFSDDSLTVCPQCEGRLRKVFNAVGVVFKGSGFYRNDSRGQQPGADSPAAGKESSGSGENGSAGKDAGGKGSGDKGTGDKGSAPAKPEKSKDGGAATSPSAAASPA